MSENEVFEIKHTAASIYGAGADTTVSAQCCVSVLLVIFIPLKYYLPDAFFLAMVRHPGRWLSYVCWRSLLIIFTEVLKKAQAEIDAVVGSDRLPSFSDREHLPYVNAVMTEALRWNSVAPTGWLFRSSFTIWHFNNYLFRCSPQSYGRRHYRWLFHSQRDYHNCQPMVRHSFHQSRSRSELRRRNMLNDPEMYVG